MKGQDTWEIGRYIDKQSWAIMPGDEKPDSGVADALRQSISRNRFHRTPGSDFLRTAR
jgi:hypothetical protein